MSRAAAALLLALLPTAAAQQTAPDPLLLERRLATVLRQSTRHYEAGEYQVALDRLGRLQGPPAQDLSVLNLRGAALTKLGRSDEAVELFRSILDTDPDYFPALFNLGEVEFLRGNHAEALELFQGLRRRDPRNELILFKIFLCQQLLGQDEAAQETAKVFIPAGKTPAWYYTQAMIARKAGDEKKAKKHLAAGRAIYLESSCRLFDEAVAVVKY
jgi:tetratricopeptide (TPR) repeat protein